MYQLSSPDAGAEAPAGPALAPRRMRAFARALLLVVLQPVATAARFRADLVAVIKAEVLVAIDAH